ncbi:MAG: T9SS type A sorting domain-containing protein [Bacteroidia bacterium]|nr:T9SS type A sorting domain-containing protein [Bacteroidia bacterium]
MKSKIKYVRITTISIFFICHLIQAQQPNFQWAKAFTTTSASTGVCRSNDVAVDFSGNVLSTGYFSGIVDFDPGAGTYTLLPSGLSTYITKLDASGNFVWVKQFIGATSGGAGNALTTDVNGNVYIAGNFESTVDFDPGPGTFNLTSAGNKDIFICKLDANGNFLWAKRIGGNSISLPGDGVESIKLDTFGNVYTTGYFSGTVDFNPGSGSYNLTSIGSSDVYISKLDANGNFLWARTFGSTSGDEGYSIDTDQWNNVYVTGQYRTTVDFDAGLGTYTLTSNGNTDVFITKYSSAGNFIWAKAFGGIIADKGSAINIDNTGNVITTGYFTYTTDFDPGPATFTMNPVSLGAKDIFVSKLDSAGNFIWAKSMGGNGGDDEGFSVVTDSQRNIYSTGYFNADADFDPSAATYTLNYQSFSEIYISKLDSLGDFVWALLISGNNNERSKSMVLDQYESIYTCGYFGGAFGGSVDFDPSPATFSIASSGSDEAAFIQKLSPPCSAPASPVNVTPVSNQTLCENSTTTLSSTASGTISWFTTPTGTSSIATGSVITFSSPSAGIYTFYVEATTCTVSAIRTAITITVHPTPTLTTITSNTIICAGESATLIVSGGDTYLWAPTVSNNSIAIVSPSTTTIYTVNASNNFNCNSTITIALNVNACVDITENAGHLFNIKFYPNPSNEFITIESEKNFNTISIKDLLGRELITITNNSGNIYRLGIADLLPGAYFISLNNENTTITYKIIKQ